MLYIFEYVLNWIELLRHRSIVRSRFLSQGSRKRPVTTSIALPKMMKPMAWFSDDQKQWTQRLNLLKSNGPRICFTQGLGSAPNKMYYNSADAPAGTASQSMVEEVSNKIGSIFTLDESPPVFTELSMVDPTVGDSVRDKSKALRVEGSKFAMQQCHWQLVMLSESFG